MTTITKEEEHQGIVKNMEVSLSWAQTTILAPSAGKANDFFGNAVSMSGEVAVIGAPRTQVGTNVKQGKAYVYRKSGSAWILEASLAASDGASYDLFGSSVAILNDAIVVGSPNATVSGHLGQGKSYVFKKTTSWSQMQILTSTGSPNDKFGSSIAISSDYVVIGAYNALSGANVSQGKVYLYKNNSGTWSYDVELFSNDSKDHDFFGYSVGINGDVIAVGAPNAQVGTQSYQGKAYVFRLVESLWTQEAMLVSADGSQNDRMGTAVDVFGSFVFVGIPYAQVGSNDNEGKVVVYEYNSPSWAVLFTVYCQSGADGTLFGSALRFSGEVLLVGAPWATVGSNANQGQVFAYRKDGDYFAYEATLQASDGRAENQFGKSVGISGNVGIVGSSIYGTTSAEEGSTALVQYQGEAYMFLRTPSTIPPVVFQKCDSLYSSFKCYWYSLLPSVYQYQIKYLENYSVITSPSLSGGVYSKVFSAPAYPDVKGNLDCLIQIHACNTTTGECGEPSYIYPLTTRISKLNNFAFNASRDSIQFSWTAPNVPIEGGYPKLDHYNITYQTGILPAKSSLISNQATSYLLSGLELVTNYSISIFACRTSACTGEDQGEVQSKWISTIFNAVQNFACSVSNYYTISCSWTQPNDPITPYYYYLTYSAATQNNSGSKNTTAKSTSFTALYSNVDYQISVYAVDKNYELGIVSSTTVKTTQLPVPEVTGTSTQSEQIRYNFNTISQAKGYLITLDNGATWTNFTSVSVYSGSATAIKQKIPGNVEYSTMIRYCSEITCNLALAGSPTNTSLLTPSLGSVSSLNCTGGIGSVNCTWNPLVLSGGLRKYIFSYGSDSVCLSNQTTQIFRDNLVQGVTYEIGVVSSADYNCDSSSYSSPATRVSVFTLKSEQSSSDSHSTVVITATLCIFFGLILILIIFFISRKRYKIQEEKAKQNLAFNLDELEIQ
ncbi:hypothetical protein M0811_11657 [Anaeramoeba ignava]|uniref:Fibronectin type-III domain-containing protein n=1 Tax=Anaeramoeba ignava TaxID=1746090 RepID=A0A9Q0R834_ANAIG|nr:hypothetical protein M0811_11657 [Anaeramoeba ignava]